MVDLQGSLTNRLAFQMADSLSVFSSSSLVTMTEDLSLCTSYLPCTFRLSDLRILWRDGSIRCQGPCELQLTDVQSSCSGSALVAPMMIMTGAGMTMRRSSVSDCRCLSDGCFLLLLQSSVADIADSSFQRLRSELGGAAVTASSSQLTISSCRFLACSSQFGGAIYAQYRREETEELSWSITRTMTSSNIAISSSLFRGCGARQGGALFIAESLISLSDVALEGNEASYGGGLYFSDMQSAVDLDSVVFVNNTADFSGGAAFFFHSSQAIPSSVPTGCKEVNQARIWGPCFGSTFHRLSAQLLGSDLFAGVELPVMVAKLDAFGQVIRTGEETLQMFVVKDKGMENNDRIAMLGVNIKRLEGGEAKFDLAFKLTFTLIDTEKRKTSVESLPLIYAEGTDRETAEIIRSELLSVVMRGDELVCPRGYVLSVSSSLPAFGSCDFCKSGSYSVNPFFGGPACVPCPAGGLCVEGGENISFPVGEWCLEQSEYRLQSCPAGYYPIRDNSKPVKDDCVPCIFGTYSLSSISVGQSAACIPCPKSVACLGGMDLRAKPGYFIVLRQRSSEGRTGTRSELTLVPYRCITPACLDNNTCAQGYLGVACGFCNETVDEKGLRWLRVGIKCVQCARDQPTVAFAVSISMIGLFFWLSVFWAPMFPWLIRRCFFKTIGEQVLTAMERCSTFQEGVEGFMSVLTTAIKIVIGFYQVTLAFINHFYIVKWPDSLTSLVTGLSFISLDFFSLPGTDCISASLAYFEKLCIVIFVPPVVIALLVLPALVARYREVNLRRELEQKVMFWILFFLFTIYPFVSSVILQTFVCVEFGPEQNYLVADFRVECPLKRRGKELILAIIFTLVYPLGIPLFMLSVLFFNDVPRLAHRKLFYAKLTQLLKNTHFAQADQQLIMIIETRVASCPLSVDPLLQLSTLELQTVCGCLETPSHKRPIEGKGQVEVQLETERHTADLVELKDLLKSAIAAEQLSSVKLQWGGSEQGTSAWFEQEQGALKHVGFLFESYRVEFWYFEVIEMCRKLLMTSVVLFIYQGSYLQVAFAAFFTFLFFALYLYCKPLIHPDLDQQQALALVVQFFTLFYGITLVLKDQDQDQDQLTYNAYYSVLENLILFLNSAIAFYVFIKYTLLLLLRTTLCQLNRIYSNTARRNGNGRTPDYSYSNFTFAQDAHSLGTATRAAPRDSLHNVCKDEDVEVNDVEASNNDDQDIEPVALEANNTLKKEKTETSSSYSDMDIFGGYKLPL
eukprot:49571-Hanusia_phi.AAC.2